MSLNKAKPRVAVFANSAWNIHNFRRSLVMALIDAGYEVSALGNRDEFAYKLPCPFFDVPMSARGINPISELALVARTLHKLRALRPDVLLSYTIKPNIYGTLSAKLLGIPTISNVSGLGTSFIDNGFTSQLARSLYRFSQTHARKVFFQNEDDRRLFLSCGRVRHERTARIAGSGIDPQRFSPRASTKGDGSLRFLYVGRLLIDKGLTEYVAAASQLLREGLHAEFCILGPIASEYPGGIARQEVDAWVAAGFVRYLGEVEDVRPTLADADCVVLPSYREGLPRSILEAASMGKPVVASDVAGCRDVVIDGVNGFLCQVRDSHSLADAMRRMANLEPQTRAQMGSAGRARIIADFDESKIFKCYFEAIDDALGSSLASTGLSPEG